MLEIIIGAIKIIVTVFACYVTVNLIRNKIKSKPYFVVAVVLILWTVIIIGLWDQEYRSRNVFFQKTQVPQQEKTMKQYIYKPNPNIKSINGNGYNEKELLEKNKQENVERKDYFDSLDVLRQKSS